MSHFGFTALQINCPKPIMSVDMSPHLSRGIQSSSSLRLSSGVLAPFDVHLLRSYNTKKPKSYCSLWEIRCTCVSTMIPSHSPHATNIISRATFGPIPGSVIYIWVKKKENSLARTNSLIVRGISPSYRWFKISAISFIWSAFFLLFLLSDFTKNPYYYLWNPTGVSNKFNVSTDMVKIETTVNPFVCLCKRFIASAVISSFVWVLKRAAIRACQRWLYDRVCVVLTHRIEVSVRTFFGIDVSNNLCVPWESTGAMPPLLRTSYRRPNILRRVSMMLLPMVTVGCLVTLKSSDGKFRFLAVVAVSIPSSLLLFCIDERLEFESANRIKGLLSPAVLCVSLSMVANLTWR